MKTLRLSLACFAVALTFWCASTASAQNISYIEEIHNNTGHHFLMWARDTRNLGAYHDLNSGKRLGDNDHKHFFVLRDGAKLRSHFCGIPWYSNGDHYRAIAKINTVDEDHDKIYESNRGVKLEQSIVDDGDFIHFIDRKSGKRIAQIPLGRGADRRFTMVIDPVDPQKPFGEFRLNLELRNTNSVKQDILKTLEKFASDQYEDFREIRKDVAAAIAGSLVPTP